MKVLVTGSEGFLGRRLCALLDAQTEHIVLRYDLQLGHDVLNAEQLDDDSVNVFYKNHPLPRVGMPIEVAKMSMFLAGDNASYSTGAEFKVDGGWDAGLTLDFLPSS